MNKNKQQKQARTLVIVTGFMFEIIVIIAVGFFLGRWLDQQFQTSILFTVLGMILFMFVGIIRLIVRINKMEDSNGQ